DSQWVHGDGTNRIHDLPTWLLEAVTVVCFALLGTLVVGAAIMRPDPVTFGAVVFTWAMWVVARSALHGMRELDSVGEDVGAAELGRAENEQLHRVLRDG